MLGENGGVGDFVPLCRLPDQVYMRKEIGGGEAVGEKAREAVGLDVSREGAHLLLLRAGAGDEQEEILVEIMQNITGPQGGGVSRTIRQRTHTQNQPGVRR